MKLFGKGDGGLGCINCHDFAGHRSAGDLRGPDMTGMHARVRTDWLLRWLREPARLQPGTAMPAFFSDMAAELAHAKMDALVRALAAGAALPLPEGLLDGPADYRLAVRDEPVVLRTFLADSSTRSIAVGLPVCVTDDPDDARGRAAKIFEVYGHLPSYRAMLDREGADGPADVAIVGDETSVAAQIRALAEGGVTDFAAAEFAQSADEVRRTRDTLRSLL